MNFKKGIHLISEALKDPLPGVEAQHIMAPKQRKTTEVLLRESSSHRLGSVMILLFPDEQDLLSTIFIERPINNSVHSGQIAFPGGKVEPDDDGPMHAAVRETEEEIGVSASSIKVIGTLSPLFIPASNFLVIPHLGFVPEKPIFNPNPLEVRSLIPTTVSHILELNSELKVFPTSYGNLPAPYFNLKGHAVWGATAMILSEFREMIKEMIDDK